MTGLQYCFLIVSEDTGIKLFFGIVSATIDRRVIQNHRFHDLWFGSDNEARTPTNALICVREVRRMSNTPEPLIYWYKHNIQLTYSGDVNVHRFHVLCPWLALVTPDMMKELQQKALFRLARMQDYIPLFFGMLNLNTVYSNRINNKKKAYQPHPYIYCSTRFDA